MTLPWPVVGLPELRATRIAAVLLPFLAGAVLASNPILDWNTAMMDAVRLDNSAPTLSSRNLAILHTAIYDAVNSIIRTHQPYRFQADAPPGTSVTAAIAAAGHDVMAALYPPVAARADSLFEDQLSPLPATAATTNGIALGRTLARQALESRQADGANTQVPYVPGDAPGRWRRTPPFFRPPTDPHWRLVKPFAIPSLEPFIPPTPPSLDSAEYAAALNEVKSIGSAGSTVRTPEQAQVAAYWSDFSYTAMPPGHWHEIAATIAHDRNPSVPDTARLLALLSLAQADAAIVCWEAKYRFDTWRPVTAIRRAAEDGNPATEPDPEWNHFLASPPFPEYPSGHSTFSAASAVVLSRFFGTDAITFTTRSDSLPGVFRRFGSLSACADEVGMSRIYGGIHFQFANREGKRSGAKVADHVCDNWLLPLGELPMARAERLPDGGQALRVHGRIGEACILEVTADRKNWTPVATNAGVPGGWIFPIPGTSSPDAHRVSRRR